MQIIKAKEFKTGMIIRFRDGQGLTKNKPKQVTVGNLRISDDEVLVYIETAKSSQLYAMNPEREFDLVDVA